MVLFVGTRWDGFGYAPPGDMSAANATWLSPNQYHNRAPWYTAVSNNLVTGNSTSQEIRDKEIGIAHSCGIDAFAYVWVGDEFEYFASGQGDALWNGANSGIDLHMSSSKKLMTKAAALISGGYETPNAQTPSTTGWSTLSVPKLVSYMIDPCYLKVNIGGDDRPILFWFHPDGSVTLWGGTTPCKAAIDLLRAAVVTAGGENPYIIGMQSTGNLTALGMDAACYYQQQPTSNNQSYASLVAVTEGDWDSFSGSHDATTWSTAGQDFNPISDEPNNNLSYAEAIGQDTPGFESVRPTVAALTAHIANAFAFAEANPSLNLTQIVNHYSYSEATECVYPLQPSQDGENGAAIQAVAAAIQRQRDPRGTYRSRGLPYNSR